MVRSIYSVNLRYYTLVNVPVVITSFFPIHRMKENSMELYLVRGQFQSDIIGKDNFKSVEIGRMQPSCCTIIFVIYGIKCNTGIIQRS